MQREVLVTEESGVLHSGGVNLSTEAIGAHEAEDHELHRIRMRCYFFALLGEELPKLLTFQRMGFDRKRVCSVSRIDLGVSMASGHPLGWTGLWTGCAVLVLRC
jgi:hypothetical protein